MARYSQKKLQEAQLNILHEIDRVCNENDIIYWLAFGTAIGAVRHKGFIPWDDDIDLFMRAEDIEKLERLQSAFSKNIFIQSRRTDPEYGLMISRVRDSNTTLIENAESDRNINHGIFVDIYPLYNCPDSENKHKRFYRHSLIARLLLYGRAPESHGKLLRIGSRVILAIMPKTLRKKIAENIYLEMRNQNETGYITYAYGHTGKMKFPMDYFYPVKRVPFEDMMAPISENTDKLLRQIYGDYMKLPPKEKQVVHHDFKLVDCDHSYKEYYRIQYCEKE